LAVLHCNEDANAGKLGTDMVEMPPPLTCGGSRRKFTAQEINQLSLALDAPPYVPVTATPLVVHWQRVSKPKVLLRVEPRTITREINRAAFFRLVVLYGTDYSAERKKQENVLL
jgi:hypothetical protein